MLLKDIQNLKFKKNNNNIEKNFFLFSNCLYNPQIITTAEGINFSFLAIVLYDSKS